MDSTHPIDQQEVMAYLDGELPVERAAVVAGHLEQCAECRSVAEDVRLVGRQMLAWQVEPSPTRLADGIRAAQASPAQAKTQAGQKKSLWGRLVSQKALVRPWVWGLAGTASVALLLLLSILNLTVMRHALQEPPHPVSYSLVKVNARGAP